MHPLTFSLFGFPSHVCLHCYFGCVPNTCERFFMLVCVYRHQGFNSLAPRLRLRPSRREQDHDVEFLLHPSTLLRNLGPTVNELCSCCLETTETRPPPSSLHGNIFDSERNELQMSLLLNLERPQDAVDYWEPGSPLQAQLTSDEARKNKYWHRQK